MAAQRISEDGPYRVPQTLSSWKAQCQDLHVRLSGHCNCYYQVHWTSAFVWELDYDKACGIDTCPFCSPAEQDHASLSNNGPADFHNNTDMSNAQREGPAAGPYELRSPSLDSQSNELYSGSPIVESYDTGEHDTEGYDSQGFDAEGFDANSYNAEGFDVDGYDAEGYDVDGFDAEGYDAEGHDVDGYNAEGLDAEGLEVEDQAMEDCNVVYHGLGDRGMGDPNMGDHDMGDYNDDIDSDDSYEFSSDEESFVFEPRSEYHPGWTKDLSPSLNPNHSTPPEVMK
ncbi:hypothetical protein IWZ01DRAFT_540698 [Phyllosticta capitalensis]